MIKEKQLLLNPIPVNTWRWLGVNQARVNEHLKEEIIAEKIDEELRRNYLDSIMKENFIKIHKELNQEDNTKENINTEENINKEKNIDTEENLSTEKNTNTEDNINTKEKILKDENINKYERVYNAANINKVANHHIQLTPYTNNLSYYLKNSQVSSILSLTNEENKNSITQLQYVGIHDDVTKQVENYYNTGVHIHTQKGMKLLEPLILEYCVEKEQKRMIDNNCIIAEEDSEVTIIVRYNSEEAIYHNGLTKILGKKGSKIHFIKIQTLDENSLHMDAVYASLEEDASIQFTSIEFGAQNSITNYRTDLSGADSKASLETAYIFDKDRKIDMNYQMNHIGISSTSNIEVKGALLDCADKIFRGTIDLRKGANKSIGKEEEYAVLLSEKVRNRSVPILLCTEDEVEGQHAASTGKIDEDKLFYLMSRGLNELEAKKLIIEASLTPILDQIPSSSIKEEVYNYVRRKILNE